jgi:nicotinate-nucleotide adenylyltransferase
MIGILGGTFDPVHHGHLRISMEAYENHGLEKINFVPCKLPLDKNAPAVSAEHRIAMLNLALAPYPYFQLNLCEINRLTPSYMLETLKVFIQDAPDQKFALILGSDQLQKFHQWHGYKEILGLVELIIMPRLMPISSTMIRMLIQTNKNPAGLLPKTVLDYIQKHHLYH